MGIRCIFFLVAEHPMQCGCHADDHDDRGEHRGDHGQLPVEQDQDCTGQYQRPLNYDHDDQSPADRTKPREHEQRQTDRRVDSQAVPIAFDLTEAFVDHRDMPDEQPARGTLSQLTQC